jgi:hypothetical protein
LESREPAAVIADPYRRDRSPAESAISTSWLSRCVPVPMAASTASASMIMRLSPSEMDRRRHRPGGITVWHMCDGPRQRADRLLVRSTWRARPGPAKPTRQKESTHTRGQIRSESPSPSAPILTAVHPEPPGRHSRIRTYVSGVQRCPDRSASWHDRQPSIRTRSFRVKGRSPGCFQVGSQGPHLSVAGLGGCDGVQPPLPWHALQLG